MPYKSDAQRKFFNANSDKLKEQGVDVAEWNAASKGKKLPAKAKEEEKVAFVRALLEIVKRQRKGSTEPVADKKPAPATGAALKKPAPTAKDDEAKEVPANGAKPITPVEKAAFGILEALGGIGGAVAGGLPAPEVTAGNNPIMNRLRGDTYPHENKRIEGALRGAAAGLVGALGGRLGYGSGKLLASSPLLKALVGKASPLVDVALPGLGAIGGAGVGGTGGALGMRYLQNMVDEAHDVGKTIKKKAAYLSPLEKKAFLDLVTAANGWQQLIKRGFASAEHMSGLTGAYHGGKIAPGLVAGGLAGLAKGMYEDPGYDPRTGKKKSRLINALKNTLGGAAIGGAATELIGVPVGQLGADIGGGLGGKIAPGLAAGGLAGLAKGMYEDPGYDPRTGKKKSRIRNALKNTLGGAAIGGATTGLIGVPTSQMGADIGYDVGRKLASEKQAYAQLIGRGLNAAGNFAGRMFGRSAPNALPGVAGSGVGAVPRAAAPVAANALPGVAGSGVGSIPRATQFSAKGSPIATRPNWQRMQAQSAAPVAAPVAAATPGFARSTLDAARDWFTPTNMAGLGLTTALGGAGMAAYNRYVTPVQQQLMQGTEQLGNSMWSQRSRLPTIISAMGQ